MSNTSTKATEVADSPLNEVVEWLRWNAAIATVLSIVLVMVGFTTAISYSHERALAFDNGQPGWIARLVPFAVDGIVLASSVVLLWAKFHGITGKLRLLRPRLWAAVGVGATIAANWFADLHYGWLGPAVSASCGVSLVIIGDMLFWLIGEHRGPVEPDQPAAAVACSCAPLPLSVAEALPLVRLELAERGLPAGEQALADRFQLTRHEVRKHLAGMTPAQSNGDSPE